MHVIDVGENTSFWFDFWQLIGPPHQKFSGKFLHPLGLIVKGLKWLNLLNVGIGNGLKVESLISR